MQKILALSLLFLSLPSLALAGSGAGAINMTFNTSARANGMGNAGSAVTWGIETNHWANPALLAFRPGLHYISFESQLAVGFVDDIFLHNEELTLGGYGVTFLLAKGPVNGNYLDMGMQMGVDENGQETGEFHSYMESKSWGFGVDAVQLLEHMLGKKEKLWSRYVSLAGGITWHDFKDQLASSGALQEGNGGSAEGSARSQGFVLRVMPVDLTQGEGFSNNGLLGLRVAGSYGASVLNKTDEFIMHVYADQTDPFPRTYITGWSIDAQLTLADNAREKLNADGFGILGDMINPLLSFTWAKDLQEPGYVWKEDGYEYGRDSSGLYDEEGSGWEVGLANILFLRSGHFTAEYGDIDDETIGGGWKIQAGKLGGFRKDWADFPQARGLQTTRRTTWSIWLNPLAIKDTFF